MYAVRLLYRPSDRVLLVQGITHICSMTVVQPIGQAVLLMQGVTHIGCMTVVQPIRQGILYIYY